MPQPIPELYAKIVEIRSRDRDQGRTLSGQVNLERLLGGEYTPDEIRTALRAVQKAEAHGLPADTRYMVGEDDGRGHYVIPQRPGEACTSDDAEQYLALLDEQGRVPEPVVVPELSLVDRIQALFAEADMSGRKRPGRNALATLLGVGRWRTDKALAEIAAESTPPVATGELAAVRFGGNPKSDRADELSLPGDGGSPFDAIRRVRSDGSEYWAGRELMPLMAYANWREFAEVVERAKASGRNTGMDVTTSFTGVDKAGFITGHSPYDYHLSARGGVPGRDERRPPEAGSRGGPGLLRGPDRACGTGVAGRRGVACAAVRFRTRPGCRDDADHAGRSGRLGDAGDRAGRDDASPEAARPVADVGRHRASGRVGEVVRVDAESGVRGVAGNGRAVQEGGSDHRAGPESSKGRLGIVLCYGR